MIQKAVLTAVLTICLTTFMRAIPITLHNGSLSSIPLIIPGVMNPNLSPMSNSGIGLEVGQKVYFKHQGKRYVLFTVMSDMESKTIEVDELLEKRKRELELESAGIFWWENLLP